MSDDNLTTRILIEIRDRLDQTRIELNSRLDQTNARLDQTDARLEQLRAEMRSEFGAVRNELLVADVRQSTRITELTASWLRTYETCVAPQRDLRDRVERCESDTAALKRRD
jgi:hypothetical protein